MKKWLVLLLLAALLVVGYLLVRQYEFTPDFAQPKYGEVTRGDIRVPITAAGLIHANHVVEIKPKASGEVTRVAVVEGDFVKAGDVLVELDPQDEQRLVDRAQADYDRSMALLRQAEVAIERAGVNIDSAQARLEEIAATGEMIAYEKSKIEGTIKADGTSPHYSDQQIHDIRSQSRMNAAQQDSARAAVRAAELAKDDAEAAKRSQEAVVLSARKTLEDAQERLRETTVLAPTDGVVTEVFIKSGMLVQSGTQSLMGGTQLMKIADVSKKKVIARLDEADYGRVLDVSPLDALPDMPQLRAAAAEDAARLAERGGAVRITVDAFPEDTFTGRIERVEPQGKLNPGSSIIQFDVHVEITDEERHRLPLGAQTQVEFTVESATNALRVPADAVKTRQDQRGVYVKRPPKPGEKHGWKWLTCRFGISDGEFTQVIEVVGGEDLPVGAEVFTKLPPDIEQSE